jgi:2,5-furandicarboxylate decarboxylase 1
VLNEGPASFQEIMAARGSRDGRDVVRELDKLYATDKLGRLENGKYVLKEAQK